MSLYVNRIELSRKDGELTLTIPGNKPISGILFLSAWMFVWSMAWIAALGWLRRGGLGFPATSFLTLWFLVWTAGGVFSGTALAWIMIGFERITLNTRELRHDRILPYWTRSWSYPTKTLEHFRSRAHLPKEDHRKELPTIFSKPDMGMITLRHDLGSHAIGLGLTAEQASELAPLLQNHLDDLKAPGPR